jgi:hypothetical protein
VFPGYWVATDDCSVTRPMTVANLATLAPALQKILNGIAETRNICGDRYFRADCTEYQGFILREDLPPVCQQGKCSVRTALH